MARAGTAAAGSSGVTGAAEAAAAWGAPFTAQTRCSRRREAWSIFFVSNFFKEQFGVSLSTDSREASSTEAHQQRRCSTRQYGMGRGLVAAVAASLLMSVMADCSKSSKVVRSSNAWATGYDEWCGALTHASSPFQSSKVCARA